MKLRFFLTFLSVLILSGAFSSFEAAAAFKFQENSPLASGRWIKVNVTENGIYEISYDHLREMGFADPSKVGVYGKGGIALPLNFSTSTSYSTQAFTDGLMPVRVLHENNRLYFYGRGVENISYNGSTGQFINNGLNIYAYQGSYFLTDKDAAPLEMTTFNVQDASMHEQNTRPVDYVCFQEDIYQNSGNSGQVYWGESLLGSKSLKWKYELPYLETNRACRLDLNYYRSKNSYGYFTYGVTGAAGGGSFSFTSTSPSANTIQPVSVQISSVRPTSKEVELYLNGSDVDGNFVNLDYWIFKYNKIIPDLTSPSASSQERLFFQTGSQMGCFPIVAGKGIKAFDVSDPDNVMILPEGEKDGVDMAFFEGGLSKRDIILCNISRPMMQISGYQEVNNTNLHALAREGADLLIITVPAYREQAEKIADLHRSREGIKVLVADVNDVYNEFSSGVPDPMAYRSLVKLCYEKGSVPLRNVLFIGLVYGNFRNSIVDGKIDNAIIGYQDLYLEESARAANAMDFYGIMEEYISPNSLYSQSMKVGVGVLPFYNKEDADLAVRKIEYVLNYNDIASTTNEFYSIGGSQNQHAHAINAKKSFENLDNILPNPCITPTMALDAYGYTNAKKKFLDDINHGKLLIMYQGHGGQRMLDIKPDFFETADALALKNKHLPFICIAGCTLSGTDWVRRGLGEVLVTGTSHGAAATLIATRTTWSNQNLSFCNRVINAFYTGIDKKPRTTSPTLGEIVAAAKNNGSSRNDLCYLLIGDPALKLHVPLRKATCFISAEKAAPGERVTVSGSVLNAAGSETDNDYNGEISLKLIAPSFSARSANLITGDATELNMEYNDTHIEEYKAKVVDGKYSFSFTIPASATTYDGKNLDVYVGTFDPQMEIASAGHTTLAIASAASPAAVIDNEAPVATAEFDRSLQALRVTVTDNSELGSGCLSADINNTPEEVFNASPDNAVASIQQYLIPATHLPSGEYTLTLRYSDIAGNRSEYISKFMVEPPLPASRLTASTKAVSDKITFSFDDASANADTLLIEDLAGNPVFSGSFSATGGEWDCLGNDGNRVAPGLYKARLISNSADKHSFSEWEFFAVLE